MPKTHNNLFCDVVDWENLYRSFQAARKGKRYAFPTMSFAKDLEENLVNIQNHLIWETWQPGKWHEFVVHEPKRRLIQAPPFADRVVHHALVNVIGPLFERKFIYDSYACRQGRGFHMAADRVQYFLKSQLRGNNNKRLYVLKADISKCFPSIHHDTLMAILGRTICDPQVLSLLRRIIYQPAMPGRGIPVGALTSQMFANVYLDQLDHYIKDGLGAKCYCRYMDDFIIISNDKHRLRYMLREIEAYLNINLLLNLNPKTSIFPYFRGVDFCGYRIWPTHKLPRKRIVLRAKRQILSAARLCSQGLLPLEILRQRIQSFLGYMKHCDGYNTTINILRQAVVRRSVTCS